MMAGEIMIALNLHDARVVIEQGRVRLLFPEDRPPPAELIEAARARKEEIRTLLTDDERARQGGAEDDSDLHDGDGVLLRRGTYSQALATLRAECPACVDAADWQRAIEDGHRFVTQWGKQAEVLGWAPADLFGLHIPPEKPAPKYRRLARYDQTGLIWLLHGRPVIALTQTAATILAPSGASLTYRRYIKPALPLGASTDRGGVVP
jgi:hypothetical protein